MAAQHERQQARDRSGVAWEGVESTSKSKSETQPEAAKSDGPLKQRTRRLMTCSADKSLRVWRRVEAAEIAESGVVPSTMRAAPQGETGEIEAVLPAAHTRAVYAVAWSEDREGGETEEDEKEEEKKAEKGPGKWQILATTEMGHGPYEINHVTWCQRFDGGEGEMVVSSGDDGAVRAWERLGITDVRGDPNSLEYATSSLTDKRRWLRMPDRQEIDKASYVVLTARTQMYLKLSVQPNANSNNRVKFEKMRTAEIRAVATGRLHHDIDDAENKQVTIAVARGILIESDGPTWFYGTSSEHALLYQYNFYNTTDSLAAMIQTESPYFQYTAATASPGPFNSTIGQFGNDPIFPDATCTGTDLLCDFSWALTVKDSTDVTIAGAGLYSWFDNLDQGQACVGAQNCQQRLVEIGSGNSAFSIFNLITIGAVEMISDVENSVTILAEDNTQAIAHPFWSALGAFIDHSETQLLVCAGDDDSEECLVEPICDKSLEFSSLDTLQAATGTFPEVCTDAYAIGALSSMLGTSVANFTTINDGYDDVWGYYVRYVKQMIPSALYEFMRGPSANNPSGGPGDKFFTCVQHQHGEVSASVQCSMDSGLLSIAEYRVYYTISNSTGFYAELQELYGILPKWVVFGDEDFNPPCVAAPQCITIDQRKRGFPIPAPDEEIIVPNPKKVMTEAQPRMANLTNALYSSEIDLNLGSWLGPAVDLVEVLSMPVFMIMQAIDSMQQAADIGEEMREEERRNFILMIISIIFSILPFVGEAFGFIGGIAAGIGRVAVLVSTGVDIGLGIEQIVHDKGSAPMAILGMLGGGLTRSEFNIGKLASTRRGFLPTDIKSMGTVFKNRDDQLQTIIGACKRS
ncbi:hypothetical protein V492_05322 [Pseudogymnoascus sp. VKM F-4246]|nr:hypothetical protein V492_05322 [Pseudogymnoascus sp. VKM F-4246]